MRYQLLINFTSLLLAPSIGLLLFTPIALQCLIQPSLADSHLLVSQNQPNTTLDGVWKIVKAETPDGQKYTGTVTIQTISSAEQVYTLLWETSIGKRSGVALFENGIFLLVGQGSQLMQVLSSTKLVKTVR